MCLALHLSNRVSTRIQFLGWIEVMKLGHPLGQTKQTLLPGVHDGEMAYVLRAIWANYPI